MNAGAIIGGRTYHANMPLPAGFPNAKPQMDLMSQTHKGGGHNGIMMDDATNGQRLNLHAQRNMNTKVLNNRSTTVKGNHTETVVGNQDIKVEKNRYKEVLDDETTTIKKNVTSTVGLEYKLLVQGNISFESLSNDIKLKTENAQITLYNGGNIDIQGQAIQFNGEAVHLNPKVEDDTENGEMSEGSTADGESSEDDGGEGLLGGLMALGMMVATRGKVKPKVGKAALGKASKITGKAKPSTKLPSKNKLEPGTPEHKQQRWEDYQARNGKWEYDRWSKQYDTNMANVKIGLGREQAYRDKFNGKNKTIKTTLTNRQVDIFKEATKKERAYAGQLKTGKVNLTKQAKIDIAKDAELVRKGVNVEYILEKGASKPFLEALDKAKIKYKIGPQIQE